MSFVDRLKALLTGSSLFLAEEIQVDEAEDGSYSVSVPMIGHGTVIIAPEPDTPDHWGILFVTMAGVTKAASKVPSEGLLNAVVRHLVPGTHTRGVVDPQGDYS
jgi:hypothetical protein